MREAELACHNTLVPAWMSALTTGLSAYFRSRQMHIMGVGGGAGRATRETELIKNWLLFNAHQYPSYNDTMISAITSREQSLFPLSYTKAGNLLDYCSRPWLPNSAGVFLPWSKSHNLNRVLLLPWSPLLFIANARSWPAMSPFYFFGSFSGVLPPGTVGLMGEKHKVCWLWC